VAALCADKYEDHQPPLHSNIAKFALPSHNPAMDFSRYWSSRQKQVDAAMDRLLPRASTRPKTIHEAMRYSIFAGGKRLRPVICLAAAEAVGGKPEPALPLACAVECIHTYSLIHDDLPSMDNDDFRRGKPTSHKVYGEGIAVLAGDALLTIAFEMVAQAKAAPRYSTAALVRELAHAAGSQALVAGQVADLEGEGKKLKLADLQYIHENKTAALIASSIRLGAMSANATPRQLAGLTEFGRSLGLAFQVIDDILDVTQTTEKLGKSAGKDVAAQKSTYPALLGLDKAKKEADRLTARARAALKPFGKKAEAMAAIADYLLQREN
jgi:geranylgeranyl diphosphate synthase type II